MTMPPVREAHPADPPKTELAKGGQSQSRKVILGNVLSLYSLQGINYLIPALVLPYLVRTLGIERYGLIAFAQSFAQYFTVLTDYGFNFSATRSVAQTRSDSQELSRIFSAVLTIKLALLVLGGAILTIFVERVGRFHQEWPVYLVAYVAVLGYVLFPTWLYQGLERMRYISIVNGATKIASALALFIFVHKPDDYMLALAIQTCGVTVAGIFGLIVAIRVFEVHYQRPLMQELVTTWRNGWHLFVSTASITLYTNTNVFLVGILRGNVEAGYFSAAEKLVRAMQGLIAPVTQAIFPHISTLAKQSPQAALKFIMKSLRWLGGATLVPCLILALFSPQVAQICFGSGGAGCDGVIRWIALLPFLIALSNVLGVQTMVTFGMDSEFSKILMTAGGVNIAIAVPLILFLGANGAGAALLVTETFVTLAMVVALMQRKMFILEAGPSVS